MRACSASSLTATAACLPSAWQMGPPWRVTLYVSAMPGALPKSICCWSWRAHWHFAHVPSHVGLPSLLSSTAVKPLRLMVS